MHWPQPNPGGGLVVGGRVILLLRKQHHLNQNGYGNAHFAVQVREALEAKSFSMKLYNKITIMRTTKRQDTKWQKLVTPLPRDMSESYQKCRNKNSHANCQWNISMLPVTKSTLWLVSWDIVLSPRKQPGKQMLITYFARNKWVPGTARESIAGIKQSCIVMYCNDRQKCELLLFWWSPTFTKNYQVH